MLHAKDFRPLVRRPGLLERGTLRFEVNGGCDQFGNARGGQKIQLTLLAAGRDFRQNRHGAMQNLENGLAEKAVDNDPATFQEVRIPLSRFGKLPENANGLFFQLRGDNSSGFEIRDIVIELPEEDDPPPVPVRTERLLPVNPKELYAIGQVRVQAENGGVAVQTAAESGRGPASSPISPPCRTSRRKSGKTARSNLSSTAAKPAASSFSSRCRTAGRSRTPGRSPPEKSSRADRP